MVKTPKFEVTSTFGVLTEKMPVDISDIQITPGAVLFLRYKGKAVQITATKVLSPQSEFEGRIDGFDDHELEHADLTYNDVVFFRYEHIQRIFKWVEEDQV